MVSVVMVAFGRLIFGRPYTTDWPGQLRFWQLFRARGKTLLRLGPVPRPHAISGNRRRKSKLIDGQYKSVFSKHTIFQAIS